MSKLNELPYVNWLENSLKSVIESGTESICILTRNKDGEVGSGYFNCSMADKLLFAGFVQQDAMMDSLRANGYLEDDEEEEDSDDDSAEEYCE